MVPTSELCTNIFDTYQVKYTEIACKISSFMEEDKQVGSLKNNKSENDQIDLVFFTCRELCFMKDELFQHFTRFSLNFYYAECLHDSIWST
jgi:hypothetical protein